MKGLRIQNGPSEVGVPRYEGSSFAYFFAPILPKIAALHWLYQSWAFDALDISENVEKMPDNDGYIAPDTLLPRFARYVHDDWASLFAFDYYPEAPTIFAHLEPRDYPFMERHIPHCFFSIDGAYWDFYSHDQTLLNLVSTHIAALPDAYSVQVDFADFTQ
jgi:hypothetical protein